MADPRDRFVVHRLRSKPVEYNVRINHFVRDGEWVLGVSVEGVSEDPENRGRVAEDLRAAAKLLDDPEIEGALFPMDITTS